MNAGDDRRKIVVSANSSLTPEQNRRRAPPITRRRPRWPGIIVHVRWNTQYRGRSQNRPSAWSDAARIAGHYFNSTVEDPPRIRVDAFPTAEELAELQTLTV